jgi:hypothetical protein
LYGHGSGEMKSTRPDDPRLMKLQRGTSIVMSMLMGGGECSVEPVTDRP